MIKTIKTQLFGSTNSKKIHPENRPNPTNSHPLSSKNSPIQPTKQSTGVSSALRIHHPIALSNRPKPATNGKNPHIPPAKQSTETSPALRNCPKPIKSTEDSDPCYTIYLRCKDPSAYDYYKSSGAIH
jgi:hypothetical protein